MVVTRTLHVPLRGRKLRATNDILVRAEVSLLVRTRKGTRPFTFRVDPGAEMSCMPAAVARWYQINLPVAPTQGIEVKTPGGTGRPEIRAGYLQFEVAGLEGRLCSCPCCFLGDPNSDSPQPAGG